MECLDMDYLEQVGCHSRINEWNRICQEYTFAKVCQ